MKKSIVISLLTVATLFSTALCSIASTGVVTTDTLRVRERPSTDSSTIALLSIDDEVEILEEEYGWYKVKSGDKVGYVAAQYINVLADANKINEDLNKDNNENTDVNNEDPNTSNVDNQEENGQNTENKTMTVIAAGEKIYITPLINALAIKETEKDEEIKIVSQINGWSYIKLGTTSGWVRTEKIQEKELEEETTNNNNVSSQNVGYISGSSVNFRKTPSTSGEIITGLSRNAKVKIIEKDDSWTQIEYNGDTGYVSSQYISDKALEVTSRSSAARKTTNATVQTVTNTENNYQSPGNIDASEVISYAKQYLGCRYVYGGSSPAGFDCSGFTSYVYRHFGISLNRSSSGQSANGVAVSKANLQPGDIICFANSSGSSKIGHVGMYIGGGQFIHAANSRQGVIISNVTGAGYYFVTARRVI